MSTLSPEAFLFGYSQEYCIGSDQDIASLLTNTVKPVLSCHSKRRPKLAFKTDYNAGQPSAILSTFIKLPLVVKTFVLSISVAILDRFYCML